MTTNSITSSPISLAAPLEFSIPDYGLKLPKTLNSPIDQSSFSLRRYSESNEDIKALYGILQDPRLWEGGYNFSGREVDHTDLEDIRNSMVGRWVNADTDLMAILDGDSFIGITGVVDWDLNNSSFGTPAITVPKSVLTGRTVLSPDYWGTTANAEAKLMVFGEVFSRPVLDINVSISATNYRSIEASKKFGFEFNSTSTVFVEGSMTEFHRYTIDRDRWPEIKEKNLLKIGTKYEAKSQGMRSAYAR